MLVIPFTNQSNNPIHQGLETGPERNPMKDKILEDLLKERDSLKTLKESLEAEILARETRLKGVKQRWWKSIDDCSRKELTD
jgi:hypothetical protein